MSRAFAFLLLPFFSVGKKSPFLESEVMHGFCFLNNFFLNGIFIKFCQKKGGFLRPNKRFMKILEAKNLQKNYGNLTILKGVEMSVDAGEIVSIVGKSGAGKSTLLHILGTLDNADSGDLRIGGVEIRPFSAKKLAAFRNERIGFIFQFHHLLPEFTALENVSIPAMIGQKPAAETRKRATELLDYLGLADRMNHKPTQLSGGEAQRVAVARALINNPAIVFADEPTGNLDTASSQDLHTLFLKLRADFGQTFVIVTHNLELAALSDRCLTMQDGVILG
jgi:lipoprotein-releasing system ATP-binding protein